MTDRNLTDDERAMVEKFFEGQSWDMRRYFLLNEEDVRDARQRNNTERPSYFGILIHDLTTLAALLFSRLEAARTQELRMARAAEEHSAGLWELLRASEQRAAKLWSLLDDIDTLDDSCRGDNDSFRILAREAQKKRHLIANPDGGEPGGLPKVR